MLIETDRTARLLALAVCLIALPTALLAAPAVPELDPSSAGSSVAILMGLGLILRTRKRR